MQTITYNNSVNLWKIKLQMVGENDLKEKWDRLIIYISDNFGQGETLDLQAVLFLIGVQELGQGYREFSKEEKVDLLHIAICKLLSRYDYYTLEHTDQDGWPHWKPNGKLPALKPGQQTILMKEAAVLYFEEAGVVF